jgi:hypothetical protein
MRWLPFNNYNNSKSNNSNNNSLISLLKIKWHLIVCREIEEDLRLTLKDREQVDQEQEDHLETKQDQVQGMPTLGEQEAKSVHRKQEAHSMLLEVLN